MLVYLPIYIAAILEGEIYYISVCGLAISGQLQWVPVLVAGALGGATGDQLWFYILRGRVDWLNRYPKIAKYRNRVSAHVHAHETLIILASRFLPGLRTAIPVACAYADVRPLKFSSLNLVSAFAWASALMLFVKLGSRTLSAFGLEAWWGPFIPAALLIAFFIWLSRPAKPRHEP
ncbi:MAG TPA: VTT domain-containing protein [Vicinamibacterales bacterium]|nr:VTT domain-containing protein [Vicinamibacterales bacterium]